MKRVLSMILALLMVVGTMVAMPLTIGATVTTDDGWDGTKSANFEGSGYEDDPYIIDEPGDLLHLVLPHSPRLVNTLGYNGKQYVAQYTNYGSQSELNGLNDSTFETETAAKNKDIDFSLPMVRLLNYDGNVNTVDYEDEFAWGSKIYVKQVCDIDLNGKTINPLTYYWNYNNTDMVKGMFFGGVYDGQGYTIRNGYVAQRPNGNTAWTCGLFGVLWGATIKNIVFEDFHSTSHAAATAGVTMGGTGLLASRVLGTAQLYGADVVAQWGETTIENIKALDSCSVTSTDNGANGVGGFVGRAENVTINSCVYLGKVNAALDDTRVGGIVGVLTPNNAQVTGNYFGGEIVMLPKVNNATVATNAVKWQSESHLGGIVGNWAGTFTGTNKLSYNVNYGKFTGTATIDETVYLVNSHDDAQICVGGILGAASQLAQGSGATIEFKGNINLSTSSRWLNGAKNDAIVVGTTMDADRVSSMMGCYYTNTNSSSATHINLTMEDCHTVEAWSFVYGTYSTSSTLKTHMRHSGRLLESGCSVVGLANMPRVNAFVQAMYEVNDGYLGGQGTEKDPWQLDSVDDWNFFAMQMCTNNSGAEFIRYEAFNDKYLALTADIDFQGATLKPLGSYQPDTWAWSGADNNKQGHNVMNVKGTAFRGNLDGQGYALKNAIIDCHNEGGNPNWPNGGLFGSIMGATLKNLVLDGITIKDATGQVGFLVGASKACLYTYEGYEEATTNSVGGPKGNVYDVQKKDAAIDPTYNLIENVTIKDNCVMTIVDTVATYVLDSDPNTDGNQTTETYNGQSRFGGIIGTAEAVTIKNCYSGAQLITSGAITAGHYDGIGGIAGVAGVAHQIIDCIGNADIKIVETDKYLRADEWHNFGGIVGCYLNTSTTGVTATNLIQGCINMGSFNYHVTDTTAQPHAVSYGGIVGNIGGNNSGSHTFVADTKGGHKIENCYNISTDITYTCASGALSGSGNNRRVGGIAGNAWVKNNTTRDQIEIVNCSTVDMSGVCTSTYSTEAYRGFINGYFDRKCNDDTVAGTALWAISNTDGSVAVAKDATAVATLNATIKTKMINYITEKDGLHYYGFQTKDGSVSGTKSARFIFDMERITNSRFKEIRYNVTMNGRTLTVVENKIYSSFINYDQNVATPLTPTAGLTYMTALTINDIPTTGTYTLTIEAMLVRQDTDLNESGVIKAFDVEVTIDAGVVSTTHCGVTMVEGQANAQ